MSKSNDCIGGVMAVSRGATTTSPTYSFQHNRRQPSLDLRMSYELQNEAALWNARTKKYKVEIVRSAQRASGLKKEVLKLRKQFDEDTLDCERSQIEAEKAMHEYQQLQLSLKEETLKKESIAHEICIAKRQRETLLAERKALIEDITDLNMKIRNLQGEVEKNRVKWKAASHEKGKLNLEADWLLKKRRMLEQTTEQEKDGTHQLKKQISELRCSLQAVWDDSKRNGFYSNTRRTKAKPGEALWYAARTRSSINGN